MREGRRVIHVHPPLRTPPIPKTHQLKEKQPLQLAQPTFLRIQMSKLMLSNQIYTQLFAVQWNAGGSVWMVSQERPGGVRLIFQPTIHMALH